jgi:hypothetical protein
MLSNFDIFFMDQFDHVTLGGRKYEIRRKMSLSEDVSTTPMFRNPRCVFAARANGYIET